MEPLKDYFAEIHIVVEVPARGRKAAQDAIRILAELLADGRRNWYDNLRVTGEFIEVDLHPNTVTYRIDFEAPEVGIRVTIDDVIHDMHYENAESLE